MYAVVSTGGKQYRVAKDDVIVVEKLKAQVGDTVNFDVLLVADGDDVTVGADAAAAVVTGEIVDHVRGEKLTVFKFKKRKGYKKTLGHRQELTKVRVVDVSAAGSKPKAAKTAVPKPKATKTEVVETEAPAVETAEAKPKRTRTTKPKAEAAPVKTTEAPAAEAAEAKPKRTRTTKPKTEAAPATTATETPEPAEASEAKPKRTRAKKAETDESAE
jgi:large subunit ribosomal protein L21